MDKKIISEVMRELAKRKSPARAKASAANGKKGGRPKGKKVIDKPSG